jgi:hypothetical protein
MIGLSLSLCVKDIMNGVVDIEDVDLLITGTRAITRESWETVVDAYMRDYWDKNPSLAQHIVYYLEHRGRIFQPRIYNQHAELNIAKGHWVSTTAIHMLMQVNKGALVPYEPLPWEREEA